MPSMFPSPATGGDDINRRPLNEPNADATTIPTALKVVFWMLFATAAFMIFTGLVMYTAGYTGPDDVDESYKAVVVNNQEFIGGINAFAGVVIAALTSQLPKGGKNPRRLLLAIMLLVLLTDLLSFATRAGGFALAIIAVLLALEALLMFRPAVNDHIDRNHMARVMNREK
ncbi:putative membrane protein [Corynebacterium glutamicum MB001]|uniref:Hypothetical membrane protein n=2 Tax=Corynebacterium glutamicum TaxID=1718 RepID=Q8NT77_CORGL|nr:hypothetical protein [Corynebacterium glutamicum]AGT04440.1 putative membrane protein [Corynebacterium glutamicum MB001]CAF19149.1 hypothetical membrane protein [Corynebacterium glutamicum ATCC 13032]CCH23639.1 hypothetical membrane protein [Corynebacterium glutamicum K051]ASW13219.1 putative membrane protein [Corynebacterium glutamicum]AUI00041.1 hypothetical protein CYL77_02255 [Corynebacterium glutamicum]